jgi:cyclase
MPIGVGGGVSTIDQIERIFKSGAEKVIINTQLVINPSLIELAAQRFGSQSIVASIDVKKSIFGKYEVWIRGGKKNTKKNPIELAKLAENMGAGELIINSIDIDGMMTGYDLKLIKSISDEVSIPVVACGGAGNLDHLKDGYFEGNAHALAAGSMFIYHGLRRAVLINYPSKTEVKQLFNGELKIDK